MAETASAAGAASTPEYLGPTPEELDQIGRTLARYACYFVAGFLIAAATGRQTHNNRAMYVLLLLLSSSTIALLFRLREVSDELALLHLRVHVHTVHEHDRDSEQQAQYDSAPRPARKKKQPVKESTTHA